MYGQSSLRRVSLSNGSVLQSIPISSQYFAEGLSLYNNDLYQLTWREGVVFRYDRNSFLSQGTFTSPRTEGWGLTYDPTSDLLIMSDGSPNLFFIFPQNFTIKSSVAVTMDGNPVQR
jgi:glutamine cyclotransferase